MSPGAQRVGWLVAGFALGWWALGCSACATPAQPPLPQAFEVVWVAPPPVPECITRCGMRSTDFACAELQEVEDRALAGYARRVKGWKAPAMCRALKDWGVHVHPFYTGQDRALCTGNGWVLFRFENGEPFCAGGYAHLETKALEIAPSADLVSSTLMHEMGHAIDYVFEGHRGHCRWGKRGLRRAIREVSGHTDWNAAAVDVEDCKVTP